MCFLVDIFVLDQSHFMGEYIKVILEKKKRDKYIKIVDLILMMRMVVH